MQVFNAAHRKTGVVLRELGSRGKAKRPELVQCGHTVMHTEPFVKVVHLVAHGVDARAEMKGDFLRLQAEREEWNELPLARGKRGELETAVWSDAPCHGVLVGCDELGAKLRPKAKP